MQGTQTPAGQFADDMPEKRLLDSTPHGPTAHEEGVEDRLLVLQTDEGEDHRPVVAELVGHLAGKAQSSLGEQRLNVARVIAASREIELIGLLRQLRDTREIHVSVLADLELDFKLRDVLLFGGRRSLFGLSLVLLGVHRALALVLVRERHLMKHVERKQLL